MDIDYSVYLVTDQFDFTESEFLNIIEEALKGNTTIVQIREKNSSTRDFLNLAQKVKKLTDKYNVPLIINDRIDIALAVDSAGVTATPRPEAVFTFFDTARYEHIPRKYAKIILSTNIDFTNKLKYSIISTCLCRYFS